MLNEQVTRNDAPLPPEIEVQCRGADRDVGWAIGSRLADKISRAEKELMELEAFRLSQPWWMPSPFYQYLAQWRARWMLEPNVRQAYPNMLERLEGIASGSHTTLDFLFLFHAMESAATTSQQLEAVEPVGIDPAFAACTALAVTGERSKLREPMLAHNFDLVESAGPLLSLRDCAAAGQHRYFGFSLAPMAGIIDGINEHGLAISYNYAPTIDLELGMPPVSFAIEHLLGHCKTVNEAIELASQLPRSGGALLMLADASGAIASLEISAQYQQARYSPAAETLFHSNAYQTSLMQQHELPRNSYYSPQAPAALRNRRVFQSAEVRESRMAELLEGYGAIDDEDLAEIMSDHGVETSADSICMHGEYWSTMASVQLFPRERRLRIAYGSPCQAKFGDFQL